MKAHIRNPLLVLSLLFLWSAAAGQDPPAQNPWDAFDAQLAPLRPITKDTVHVLRVKRIVDRRLANLTDNEYRQLYQKIRQLTESYLGYRVQLKDTGEGEIISFFSKYAEIFDQPHFAYRLGALYLDLDLAEDRQALKKTIGRQIDQQPWDVIVRYIAPQDRAAVRTPSDAAAYLYRDFLQKHREIGHIQVAQGDIFRSKTYEFTQHYAAWTAVQHVVPDAELLITNTMIAGADADMPLYVLKRGALPAASPTTTSTIPTRARSSWACSSSCPTLPSSCGNAVPSHRTDVWISLR